VITAASGTCSVAVTGRLNAMPVRWELPEEIPIAIQINTQSHAVMMATPADLEDFVTGFLVTEGIVRHHSHISNILTLPSGEGFTVDAAIDEKHIVREQIVSRSLEGRVGCGLCGITEMEDAIRLPRHVLPHIAFREVAIARAFSALPQHQPMYAVNRTVHAAAFCSVDGSIVLSREDVGRHNALDKLVGAMAHANSGTEGFVVMSSRCSFELVQKCAVAGIGALATVSAPTALAHRLALQAGLKLAALSKEGVMMFDGDLHGNA
jgi:FdhD protein